MKRLSLQDKFELSTYQIIVKDEWIQFLVGTPEIEILESIAQEKDDNIVIAFLQRMGVSVAERKMLDSKKESTADISDVLSELFLRTEIDNEMVLRQLAFRKQAKVNSDGELYDPQKDGDNFKLLRLSDYFEKEEIKELSKIIKDLLINSGEQLNDLIVHFVNNRIVDLDKNKPIKLKFTLEQIQSLHPELYQEIANFVSYELNGYPDDEELEESELDPNDLEENDKK